MAHIQYQRTVPFDATLRDLGFDENNLIISGLKLTAGAPAATAGYFEKSCIIQNIDDGLLYQNTGTIANPVWTVQGTGGPGPKGPTGPAGAKGATGAKNYVVGATFNFGPSAVTSLTIVKGVITAIS